MLIKISKNPNANLHSDIEEKGKGKRLKKPIKYGDESDEENVKKKRLRVQSTLLSLPPIPNLTNINKSQANQSLSDKIDKEKQLLDEAYSLDNKQSTCVSHDINVSHEISSKTHRECKEGKLSTKRPS